MFEHEAELLALNHKIDQLLKNKEMLVRKFVRANRDKPVNEFFRKLRSLGGLPAALRWYMVAFDVSILHAKRDLDQLVKKE